MKTGNSIQIQVLHGLRKIAAAASIGFASICLTFCSFSVLPIAAQAAVSSGAPAKPVSKQELLTQLKAWKERVSQRIAIAEEKIHKRLGDSQGISLSPEQARRGEQKIEALQKQIETLNQERLEAIAERDIVDRMIFAVDSKWTSQPLNTFFEGQFLEMASADLGEQKPSQVWKVLTYLSVAAREIPDPHENVVAVLEGYLNYSGALSPRSPSEYAATRNYTNGSESVAARPVSRENAGDGVTLKLETSLNSKLPSNAHADSKALESSSSAAAVDLETSPARN